MLNLAVNGRFLKQALTGVQRVARELTREIDSMIAEGEAQVRLRLLCEADADVSSLQLRATQVEYLGGTTGHLWEQLVLPPAIKGDLLLCIGNTAPVLSLLGGGRVAVMIHDISYRLYPRAYTTRYRLGHAVMLPFLLRRADPIITVSAAERAMLAAVDPAAASRIMVAQNGGWRDDDAAKTIIDDERSGDFLLYVGAFSQRKNYAGLIAAAVQLARSDGLPIVLVGACDPILMPSPSQIPQDVTDMIRFAGPLDDAVLASLYRNAACLIFPSFYEGSGLPPIEAMSFGCPVVASDIASLRERGGDAAEYCDPYDTQSIVDAVRRVVRDPERARTLAAAGYHQAARYSWREQARSVLRALTASSHS